MVQNPMPILTSRSLVIVTVLLLSAACAQPGVKRQAAEPIVVPPGFTDGDRRVLAGEWEYEEGAVVLLKLDEQGNGAYAWKEGRFETTALNGLTWHGIWVQRENDREGGFTVEFLPDFSEGEGRWWYTRIGEDHAPRQKGGTFHVTRKISQARAGDTPPAP